MVFDAGPIKINGLLLMIVVFKSCICACMYDDLRFSALLLIGLHQFYCDMSIETM